MRRKQFIVFSIALVLLVVDRWLKSLAVSGVTSQLWFGQFILFRNYGIIFSWPLPNIVAIVLMFVALAVVGWLLVQSRRRSDIPKIFATSLMVVGAISNIYDRLAFGYIIDWAYLGRWWPVFNIADVCITVGLVLYLTSHRKVLS